MTREHTAIFAYPADGGGIPTRVLAAGSEGPPILFLHGAGARADRWRRIMPAVAARGFRCLAIDLPGHGFARKGEDYAYGVPAFADFVASFLDANDIGPLHLVGTSLGAHTLGELYCRAPDRALSLTLVGGTGLYPIGPEGCERLAASIGDQSIEAIERKLRNVMLDPSLVTPHLIREEWQINNSPGAREAFAKLADYFRTGLDADAVGERLAKAAAGRPLLLMWGDSDRSVPVAAGHAAAALLERELVLVPGAAHAPYFEQPELFTETLLRFLKS